MQTTFRRSELELRGPAAPQAASAFVPEAPEGCVLCRVSHCCRICRRNLSAGAPEALIGGFGGPEPPRNTQ
eukprot:15433823-Alexandrium_andersonii.AAC.1